MPDKADFLENEQIVYGYLADSEGEDEVVIYCAKERAIKKTSPKQEYTDQSADFEQTDESLRGRACKSGGKSY